MNTRFWLAIVLVLTLFGSILAIAVTISISTEKQIQYMQSQVAATDRKVQDTTALILETADAQRIQANEQLLQQEKEKQLAAIQAAQVVPDPVVQPATPVQKAVIVPRRTRAS